MITFRHTYTEADTVGVSLPVAPNLGRKWPHVTVYDANGAVIQAATWTVVDDDNLVITQIVSTPPAPQTFHVRVSA